MPGLVRKLVIFTTVEGLILQAHGGIEHHKAVCIDYKSRKITPWTQKSGKSTPGEDRLESHGIIGLINIASLSFLVAITRREQVAQIFGKPVFVVADVAIVPLSSQAGADEAIRAAHAAQSNDEGFSDSDESEIEDDHHSVPGDHMASPMEINAPLRTKPTTVTSIAQNVALRKAPYGRFASEWFSKRVWGANTTSREQSELGEVTTESSHQGDGHNSVDKVAAEAAETNIESHEESSKKETVTDNSLGAANASTLSLLPKIIRSTKLILSSHSFYFSYDFDLTRRLSTWGDRSQILTPDKLDDLYFWNRKIGSTFAESGHDTFLLPIMQGFVGQRKFTVRSREEHGALTASSDQEQNSQAISGSEKTFLLTLISRRSTKRSGLRYLRRGIDDQGNCANSAETEQILSSPDWDGNTAIRSFVQIRGSIPLYFSQSPYSLKPVPMFHNTPTANQAAFKRHFDDLAKKYQAVQIAMLVNRHGTEAAIGTAYEKTFQDLRDAGKLPNVDFEWFDFHAECRGMKFENVQLLVSKLQEKIIASGETVISQDTIRSTQQGIIRTNCMDCLDRTNVAQSAFAQGVLQRALNEEGFEIDLLHDETTNWFNTLWADNGDAISRQYASTAALKGDFTRTRKRNWQGAVNDLGLTLSRYYSNMVNDYFSQAVIDMLLGNVSWKVFEDFESTMMSADPGISVASAREAAIENCAKIVIQGENEDLIHGWTLLSPAQENTLRTLPFEETVVLLTDTAVYCCKFDWNTEKVARFEKVDLRSITKIRHGTYITSTFTKRQLDEELNQGLVIMFTPGKDDMIRVNTRSLQNQLATGSESTSVDGGTGLLSWFTPSTAKNGSHAMALKVVSETDFDDDDVGNLRHKKERPRAVAERVSEEIRRAIEGPQAVDSSKGFVEEGDIISAADAKRRTGYLEQLGHSLKRMVWA